MITPTMQAFGQSALDTMQSMLDRIDEKKRQEEEERTGQKTDPLVQARISAAEESRRSQDNISNALFSVTKVDVNELKIQLYEKLGKALGVEKTDEMSGFAYGRAIERAVAQAGSANDLAKTLGLDELGVSLETVIEAIKNPYGDASDKLGDALEKLHGDGKTTAAERGKVLQRLEDVADPKSLEELKLGEQGSDPTRVEDDETQAERQEDIKAKEAQAKLDDLQDMQTALRERLASDNATPDAEDRDADGSGDMLMVLAAIAQAASDSSDAPSEQQTDAEISVLGAQEEETDEASSDLSLEAEGDVAPTADDLAEEWQASSLPVFVASDETGIYALLVPDSHSKQRNFAPFRFDSAQS